MNPTTIVEKAISNGELDKLLLGAPEYQYRTRWSPAPGSTDLTELLAVIYDRLDAKTREKAKLELEFALNKLVHVYEGLEPVATCILIESFRKSKGRPFLNLPIEGLAEKLNKSIHTFESRLRSDNSGSGQQWADGMLGEMRLLSRNTAQVGGPSFCK